MKAFHRRLALLLVCALLLCGGAAPTASAAAEERYRTGEFHYILDAGRDLTDTYVFSDGWFTEPSTVESPRLRTISLIAAMASGSSEAQDYAGKSVNVQALLDGMGFEDVEVNRYYTLKPTELSAGCCIGRKRITVDGTVYTLLAIFPRSQGYGMEWVSNFTVGRSGLHEGFRIARDEVLRFARQYVEQHEISGALKVWISGHSRGAAIANLTAGFLADYPTWLGELTSEDLYAYTFGTPAGVPENVTAADARTVAPAADENGTPGGGTAVGTAVIDLQSERYCGIRNYYSAGDFFSKVAPADWGFTRYGTDTVVSEAWADARALRDHCLALLDPALTASPVYGDPTVDFSAKRLSADVSGIGIAENPDSTMTAEQFTGERVALLSAAVGGTRESYVDGGYQTLMQELFAGIQSGGFSLELSDPALAADLISALLRLYLYYPFTEPVNQPETLLGQLSLISLALRASSVDLSAALTGYLNDLLKGNGEIAAAAGVQTLGEIAAVAGSTAKSTEQKVAQLRADTVAAMQRVLTALWPDFPVTEQLAGNAVDVLPALLFGSAEARPFSLLTTSPRLGLNLAASELDAAVTLLGNLPALGREHINAVLLAWMRATDGSGFADVTADSYYADAVAWAVENGITQGADAVRFDPDSFCTRGQAVTFLWRAAGCPDCGTAADFADVAADSYYADAVAWAVENGITQGADAAHFAPDAPCTRGQIVTFLWRAAGCPDCGTAADFADVAPEAYYAPAVAWAVQGGVTQGADAAHFAPDNSCTRAQTVTFLHRAAT